MTSVMFAVMSMLIYSSYVPRGIIKNEKTVLHKKSVSLWVVLVLGFIARCIGAYFTKGHPTDMNCFSAWAGRMAEVGPGEFYSPDVFTDYPPGYMYVLWFIGLIKNLLPLGEAAINLLLKSPAIICDMLTACIIYRISENKLDNAASGALVFMFAANPAVYLNSAVWGQVDSIFTLATLICLYLVSEGKLILSFYVFAVAILIKPQALFYTPILLFAMAEETVYPAFKPKELCKYILWGAGAVIFALLLAAPFGLDKVIGQYIGTLASYPYKTVNAFNIWSLTGGNWEKLTNADSVFSSIAIILTVLFAMKLFFTMKGKDKYFWCAAIICVGVFTFAAKMHERYCYPAIAFMLAAVALKPDILSFGAYTAVGTLQFFNSAAVLFLFTDTLGGYHDAVARIGGALTVIVFCFCVYVSYRQNDFKIKKHTGIGVREVSDVKDYGIRKNDAVIMAVLTAVYAVIAFSNLGDMKAPESSVILGERAEDAVFSEVCDVEQIKMYPGSYNISEANAVSISFFGESGELIEDVKVDNASVFCWYEKDIEIKGAKSIKVSAQGVAEIMELAIISGGECQAVLDVTGLFDEQALVPERVSYKNGTYFDEIYHARTAYEFIKNREVYEWTHPPLGKALISVGIRIFGMNPFGWRFMGTLFGVFMVPVIFIFAKKLFGNRTIATLAAILFTFDFMHFAQTRIATIDVYITFFIMLMYMFMLIYLRGDIYSVPFKKQMMPLALCGISMGLGIASKWTGMYAGAGLGVLFFASLAREYARYKNSKTENAAFVAYVKRTIPLCILFFVIVPALIYLASYIPFVESNGGGMGAIIKNQADMFNYHSKLDATHSFSSPWYGWAVMSRPVWYYSQKVSEGVKEGISSFGNPLVWWLGIGAFVHMLYMAIKEKDKTSRFLCVCYLAQLLPWIPVTRCTFIYHYFPCVPFVAMMVAYSVMKLTEGKKYRLGAVVGMSAVCILLFAMFYPVLSGQAVSVEYVDTFLKWFSSWQLI